MITKHLLKVALLATLSIPAAVFAAGGDIHVDHVQTDLSNKASLQNGAKLYMNYCYGCHSLEYVRYNSMAEDLGITEDQLEEFFLFGDQKPGDLMKASMSKENGTAWLGKAPPDLTLVARRKAQGPDWIYTFLRSFYADPNTVTGWNNTVLPNTSMPNVLWGMQGIQALSHDDEHQGDGEGDHGPAAPQFELMQAGAMSAVDFDTQITDLTAFLEYVAEPAKIKREKLGVWVLLYLSLFTFVAYLLKREFWKDVH